MPHKKRSTMRAAYPRAQAQKRETGTESAVTAFRLMEPWMLAERPVSYSERVTQNTPLIVPGRPVKHPGSAAAVRTTLAHGRTRPRAVTDLLRPDADDRSPTALLDLVAGAVEAAGADSGIVELGPVDLPSVSYCFPAYGDSTHPMLYSATHSGAGTLLRGTATVGFRRESPGAPLTRWAHFHVSWTDREGTLRGGHLWPETTAAGPLVQSTVWPLYGITLVNRLDEETQLPVFFPEQNGRSTADGDRPALFARVHPNEEIGTVIADLTRRHGLEGGSVVGGTGSIVGAIFEDGRRVEGPATEVITLGGALTGTEPRLTSTLISASAEVHGGVLAPTGNLVGATYDLMLAGPQD
jgi:predicted DNA-binding protein with PD1-like motif